MQNRGCRLKTRAGDGGDAQCVGGVEGGSARVEARGLAADGRMVAGWQRSAEGETEGAEAEEGAGGHEEEAERW